MNMSVSRTYRNLQYIYVIGNIHYYDEKRRVLRFLAGPFGFAMAESDLILKFSMIGFIGFTVLLDSPQFTADNAYGTPHCAHDRNGNAMADARSAVADGGWGMAFRTRAYKFPGSGRTRAAQWPNGLRRRLPQACLCLKQSDERALVS